MEEEYDSCQVCGEANEDGCHRFCPARVAELEKRLKGCQQGTVNLLKQLDDVHKKLEEATRVCDKPGCIAAVVRRDNGSRVCGAGHESRWVDKADYDEALRKLKLTRKLRDEQKLQTTCFEDAYIKAERGRIDIAEKYKNLLNAIEHYEHHGKGTLALMADLQERGLTPDNWAYDALPPSRDELENSLEKAYSFMKELYEDGCEYGDNCPRFVALNHGECRACRIRYFLEEEQKDENP